MVDDKTKSSTINQDVVVEPSPKTNGEGQIEEFQGSSQQWLSSFFGKIARQIEDITYLEVLTTGANTSTLRLTGENPEIDDALKKTGDLIV